MTTRYVPVLVGNGDVSFDQRLREEAISSERNLRRMTRAYQKLLLDYQALLEENRVLRRELVGARRALIA